MVRRGWFAASLVALAAAAPLGAASLHVASMSPQGPLAGDEPPRIQILFDAAVVPLGEARASLTPPAWLRVSPPLVARWRFAGTAELIGEPLAPLPLATRFTVTIDSALTAVDGAALAGSATFWFSTPAPEATIAAQSTPLGPGTPMSVRFNQPVDPASVLERLRVTVRSRPLEAAETLLDEAAATRLERDDPAGYAGWRRFVAAAKGPTAGPVDVVVEPEPEHPLVSFTVRPAGCWPPSATLTVELLPGVRALEGSDLAGAGQSVEVESPHPFAPLRFSGRSTKSGLDPDDASLLFTREVRWEELAGAISFRSEGSTAWRTIAPDPDLWYWSWERDELPLAPLQLEGGKRVEVCVAAGARAVDGAELEFPWCGVLTTGLSQPTFYLVEGDGVVEREGPHLIPLRTRNVTAYTLEQRPVGPEELVGVLRAREEDNAPKVSGRKVPVRVASERTVLLPIDLDPALSGKPGVVLTRVAVTGVVPGSEYDEDEQRWLRTPRTSLTQVTSLGLTVKSSRHEGLLVWATSLADARPAPGVTVAVRDKENRVLFEGTTDDAGLLRTPATVSADQAYVVTARRGDDLAYAKGTWYEGHRGWEFNLPVDYNESAPVLGRVWSDRGVVRPGESLHLKAVLRRNLESGLRIPAGTEATVMVRDARGEEALHRTVSVDRWGGIELELPIAATAPLGRWEVRVGEGWDEERSWFAQNGDWGIEDSFLVAEFRRPKFRVSVTAPRTTLIAGDALEAEVEGSLLAGGAMAAAEASWSVRASRGDWRPAERRWDGFEFLPEAFIDELEDEASSTLVARGEATLDARGAAAVRLPRVEAAAGFPAELTLEGEVTDVDRQSLAGATRLRVLPGEFFLGVERPPTFVTLAQGVASRVVALAADGRPQAGVAVTLELVKRHWESVRRREVSGRYLFESRPVHTTVAEQGAMTTAEGAPFRFTIVEPGEYAIVASGVDGRGNPVRASAAFYVLGEGYTPWRMDQENRIELVPEKDRYAPGEVARILVKSPWEGALALLSVERAGVLEPRVVTLAGTMPVVEVPIHAEYAPNVFVSVVLLRGRLEAPPLPDVIDPGRPAYRIGMCELTVPPSGKRLAVTVASAKPEYRPGQNAELSLTVRGEDGSVRAAALTVWAVDAGVLSLTGFRTPDLMEEMYARRGLGITTAESRTRLVGRRSYGSKGDRAGGGGGVDVGGDVVRRDFRALAFWQGAVVTDEQGRATLRFPLPDSLTTYRVMAVATAGEDQFGSTDAEFRVSKPLGLEPALPRFLRPDDKVRAGVVIRNRTKTEQVVEVSVTVPPGAPLRLRGGASRSATVKAGGSAEVGFGFVATDPGEATLTFSATGSPPTRERDTVEARLPVLPATRSESVATFLSTSARAEEAVAVPHDVFASSGGLEVRLASTELVGAEGGVRFLVEYPHGCAEQLSSRLLGVLAAASIGEWCAPSELGGTPRARWIDEVVAKLVACQRPDGGFAFWPEGGASFPELSAHVAWALATAAEAGADVDEDVLHNAASYLSATLRRERFALGEEDGWTVRALASFALAKLGTAEPAYLQTLFDSRADDHPQWGRAVLAAAMLALDAEDPRARIVLGELANVLVAEAQIARLAEAAPADGTYPWWSEGRGSAATLLALAGAGSNRPLAERVARGLLDHLEHDRFRTTHDSAWMLQALAAYQAAFEPAASDGTAAVTLAGAEFLHASFAPAAPITATAGLAMGDLLARAGTAATLPLVVTMSGGGRAHAAVRLTSTPRRPDRPALAQGLAITRRILDGHDRPVSAVESGAVVTLEITVDGPALRRFVVAEVPLPAGIEVADERLATTARSALDGADEEGLPWEEGFDHVEVRDDRVMLYATELAPGPHTHRLRARATTAGTFLIAPAHVEEMYAPEVFGTSAAATFEVLPGAR